MKFQMPNNNRIYLILLVLYLLILFIGSLPAIPLLAGRRFFVVSSGSMEPTLSTGSVVITKPQADYQVNDIITFTNPDRDKKEKQTITHRIAQIINQNGQSMYLTKGDANVYPDGDLVLANRVIGKLDWQIGYLGYLINGIKSQAGLMFMVIIPGIIIITKEVNNIFRLRHQQPDNPKKQKKNQAKR